MVVVTLKYQYPNQSYPIENVFEIDNSKSSAYLVSNYQASLRRLEITVGTTIGFDVHYKITFSVVQFMQICGHWENAHFRLESPAKCMTLARQFKQYADFSDDEILEHFILCGGTTADKIELQILANTAKCHASR